MAHSDCTGPHGVMLAVIALAAGAWLALQLQRLAKTLGPYSHSTDSSGGGGSCAAVSERWLMLHRLSCVFAQVSHCTLVSDDRCCSICEGGKQSPFLLAVPVDGHQEVSAALCLYFFIW